MNNSAERTYCLDDLPQDIRKDLVVNPVTGCWEWRPQRNARDYGLVYRDGEQQLVHRLVYALLVGPIPPGLDIDHVQDRGCRSKACCWPYHLEPVTRAENSRRAQEWVIKRRNISIARRAAATGIRAIPVTKVKQDFTQLISDVEHRDEHVEILRVGKPAAVMVPVEWHKQARTAIAESEKGEDHATPGQ